MKQSAKLLPVIIGLMAACLTLYSVRLLFSGIPTLIAYWKMLAPIGRSQDVIYDFRWLLYPGLFWAALAGIAWAACYVLARKPAGEVREN